MSNRPPRVQLFSVNPWPPGFGCVAVRFMWLVTLVLLLGNQLERELGNNDLLYPKPWRKPSLSEALIGIGVLQMVNFSNSEFSLQLCPLGSGSLETLGLSSVHRQILLRHMSFVATFLIQSTTRRFGRGQPDKLWPRFFLGEEMDKDYIASSRLQKPYRRESFAADILDMWRLAWEVTDPMPLWMGQFHVGKLTEN